MVRVIWIGALILSATLAWGIVHLLIEIRHLNDELVRHRQFVAKKW